MRLLFPAKLLRLLISSALGLTLLLSTGCSQPVAENKDALMSNDFDHLSGWLDDAPSLTRDKAHSGAYSVVVKPGLDRSLNYDITLGQLSTTRPHKIRLSAWAMRTGNQGAAKLLVEIKDPATGAQAFREDIDLGKEVQKLNTWQHIEHVLEVPPLVPATAHIIVYMQRAGASQPTYLDDLALSRLAK
jgi:hypothetical protein